MRQSLELVSLVVRDYDEALKFYVDVLGFKLVEDTHVPEQGKRWVVVAPPGSSGARIVLARASNPDQAAHIGNQTGGRVFLFLHTDNFPRDYGQYLAKGIEFVRPPREEPFGTVAVFRDLYGNLWDLVQPMPSTSAAPSEHVLDAALYQTARLVLRPPLRDDAAVLFERYASDPEVTRFLGWPMHASLNDTEAFLSFSQAEWTKWPVGPLLITSKENGDVLGATGLAFETSYRASTGFVLARDAWGSGFASEALAAVLNIAAGANVRRLYALCHVQHGKSVAVLERCGFIREGTFHKHTVFPNLGLLEPQDVYCYAHPRGWTVS